MIRGGPFPVTTSSSLAEGPRQSRSSSRLRAGAAVDDQVADRQRRREDNQRRDQARVLQRVLEVGVDHVCEPPRAHERVPAVETQEAADVHAEAREREHRDHTKPRQHSDRPFPDHLHQVQGRVAEQEARPRKRREHERVVPKRRRRRLPEVDEVGQQVGRVRKEQQPQQPECDRRRARPAPRARVGREREHERHPREHEVPDEEAVEVAAGVVLPHHHRRDAERGGGEQSRNRQRTPVPHRRPSDPDRTAAGDRHDGEHRRGSACARAGEVSIRQECHGRRATAIRHPPRRRHSNDSTRRGGRRRPTPRHVVRPTRLSFTQANHVGRDSRRPGLSWPR